MEINKFLEELDTLISKGDFVKAAEKFFTEDIRTVNELDHSINGKDAKIESLKGLEESLAKVHSVKLVNQLVAGNTSFSEFNYHYEYHNGAQQSYGEIIKREWDQEGKVISEKYYKGAIDPVTLEPAKEKKTVAKKTTATKEATPAKEIKPKATKKATVK
ncbi:MAG: hypothetical protein U0V72_08200 [Cytophagales bacterium]